MTTQLDSCEEVLDWQGLRWERLDGTTKAADRGALLHSFSTDPNVRNSGLVCARMCGRAFCSEYSGSIRAVRARVPDW